MVSDPARRTGVTRLMLDKATFTTLVLAIAQRSIETHKFATHRIALLHGIQRLTQLSDDKLAYLVKRFKGGIPRGEITIAFQLNRPEQDQVRAIRTRLQRFFEPRVTHEMIYIAAIQLAYDVEKNSLQNIFP